MARVQQRFVKPEKLLLVEPFKITCLWSNGETRLNDFTAEANNWKAGSNKELKKLADPKVFKTAFIKDGTIAFSGSTVVVPGVEGKQPVDFDRRKLYYDSQLIGIIFTYQDAAHHRKNRRKRLPPVSESFSETSQSSAFGGDIIRKIYQKLGASVTPLVQIGDELIELT